MTLTRTVPFILFISTVWFANYLITTFGIVAVGFGLAAPAGVFAAGLSLTIRDWLHDVAGPRAVVIAILLGAALSAGLSPALAVASGTAFLVSELADLTVYTPLRDRSRVAGMVLSNTVGAIIDSALFLWLAFGSLEFLLGQVVGKSWVTLLSVPLFVVAGRARRNVVVGA
jgi:uncharacterized PurR-regulated membrane protein YhhQ (DUF165 family)